jgi:hypothetical protein
MAKKYEMPDDWQESFKKWKAEKNKKPKGYSRDVRQQEDTISKEVRLIEERVEQNFSKKSTSTKYKSRAILLSFLALVIISLEYFALKAGSSNASFLIFTIFLFILSLIFFVILFAYKAYEKSTGFINPLLALALSYALIVVNMLLSPRVYSPEWAFLGFLVIAVVFYDFKIDSRFLILPALFLLGYIPFLLIGAQKEIAETVAVYVYYFLVVGVALQIIEYYKQTKSSVDFSKFIEVPINEQKIIGALSIWGVVVIAMILLNRFYSIELLKWSSVYVFFVLLVFYAIRTLQGQKQHTPESKEI